jgi:hypothetical protein
MTQLMRSLLDGERFSNVEVRTTVFGQPDREPKPKRILRSFVVTKRGLKCLDQFSRKSGTTTTIETIGKKKVRVKVCFPQDWKTMDLIYWCRDVDIDLHRRGATES